jgi:uncharacterized iron-regulated protein
MRILTLSTVLLAACASAPTVEQTEAPKVEFDPEEHAFFDGDGNPSSLDAFVEASADADMVAFGELHYHSVGSRIELALLEAMSKQERPVALAMEFFETNTQAALDDYLAGDTDLATFKEATKRGEQYDASHGPLIEFCKANGIPVIAANAPRPLVTAYRKTDVSYEDYLAGLSEEERGQMPRETKLVDDEFKARFMETMGPKRGPLFYKSMALWNDAMAESMADFRNEHAEHRILFIVGGFHVAKHLGTVARYTDRRADDTVKVLLMSPKEEGAMGFDEDDRNEGDLILKIRMVE